MNLAQNEIIDLLKTQGAQQQDLWAKADQVRAANVGPAVHLRGLVEVSSYCHNNCAYCGLRREHQALERYRLNLDQVVTAARFAIEQGFKTIVLQAGEDNGLTQDFISAAIREIKKYSVAVTLSLGERSSEDYQAWKEAGADRYLLRIETSSPELYTQLHPGQSWQHRVACLECLRDLGYEVGSGFIVGLPGQDLAQVAQDLLWLKDFNVDMAGIGPFLPHPQTPLANFTKGDLNLSLNTVAVCRLLLPDINIPATTALGNLDPQGRFMALKAGANVMMPNFTPLTFKSLYEIYPQHHKAATGMAAGFLEELTKKLQKMGRSIGTDVGGHKKH
ncbi:MAG: [FeFe] hydrogenase H-cluster radical SAM maturase HydE [Bacteriovoracaceae bacterium]|nr:[FeFe] hydrogenase H-cluster radical SAM maturase HydE [Bacteriovoracaceae bacterium]